MRIGFGFRNRPNRAQRRNAARSKTAAVVSTVGLVASFGTTTKAGAQTVADYKRNRSGSLTWSPDLGSVSYAAETAMGPRIEKFTWRFAWSSWQRRIELPLHHRALEMKAVFPKHFIDGATGIQMNNFPTGSLEYIDTQLSNTAASDQIGFGAGDADYFGEGVEYNASVFATRNASPPSVVDIEWQFLASTRAYTNFLLCAAGVEFCVFNAHSAEPNEIPPSPTDAATRQPNTMVLVWPRPLDWEHANDPITMDANPAPEINPSCGVENPPRSWISGSNDKMAPVAASRTSTVAMNNHQVRRVVVRLEPRSVIGITALVVP